MFPGATVITGVAMALTLKKPQGYYFLWEAECSRRRRNTVAVVSALLSQFVVGPMYTCTPSRESALAQPVVEEIFSDVSSEVVPSQWGVEELVEGYRSCTIDTKSIPGKRMLVSVYTTSNGRALSIYRDEVSAAELSSPVQGFSARPSQIIIESRVAVNFE